MDWMWVVFRYLFWIIRGESGVIYKGSDFGGEVGLGYVREVKRIDLDIELVLFWRWLMELIRR